MQSVSLLFVLPCSGVSDAKPFSRSLKKKESDEVRSGFPSVKKDPHDFSKNRACLLALCIASN
jgi:hypothetical protein